MPSRSEHCHRLVSRSIKTMGRQPTHSKESWPMRWSSEPTASVLRAEMPNHSMTRDAFRSASLVATCKAAGAPNSLVAPWPPTTAGGTVAAHNGCGRAILRHLGSDQALVGSCTRLLSVALWHERRAAPSSQALRKGPTACNLQQIGLAISSGTVHSHLASLRIVSPSARRPRRSGCCGAQTLRCT